MHIKCLIQKGSLDISSQELIHGEEIVFRLVLRPNQIINIPDHYRSLKNIDSAINAGLLQILNYDSSDGSIVVQEELGKPYTNIHLNDIADMNVPTPSDKNYLTFDLNSRKWILGKDAPGVLYLYSVDGLNNWHFPFVAGDFFLKVSTNSGVTYGDPIKFVGTDGNPGKDAPGVLYLYSVDGLNNWHFPFVSGDFFFKVSMDNGVTYGDPIKFISTESVLGPANNDGDYVPQWDGENSKTLKNGFAVGTAANSLVQLNSEAKLPAVDGSLLTNLPVQTVSHPDIINRDQTAAHPSSAITFDNAGTDIAATTEQAAVVEVNAKINSKFLSATAGENVSAGDICYLKSDGKMWKTNATAEATAKGLIAIALANISAEATGSFLKQGTYTTTGLTVGAEYFLTTSAGLLSATKPSVAGNIIRIVGYALSSTILDFCPDRTYVEIS